MLFKIVSTCDGGGYRYCRTEPVHPKANSKGLYPLHRVLMENHLGRLLVVGEIVHHANGNRRDDRIENLVLLSRAEHTRIHQSPPPLVTMRCRCGRVFQLKPHIARVRARRNKGPASCSRSCGVRFGHRVQCV